MKEKRKIFYKTLLLIFAILFIILFKHYVMNKMIISGNSMADNYKNGDVIWVEKLSCKSEINRFDVVIINAKKNAVEGNIIKRVIGLPNETIIIKSGMVYVNGQKLKNDYGDFIKRSGLADAPFKLGNEEYFVMGDNRNDSSDSRDLWLGAVKKDKIIGNPLFRYFPLNRIGRVE